MEAGIDKAADYYKRMDGSEAYGNALSKSIIFLSDDPLIVYSSYTVGQGSIPQEVVEHYVTNRSIEDDGRRSN